MNREDLDLTFYKKGGRVKKKLKKNAVVKIQKGKNIHSKNVSQSQIVNIIHPTRKTYRKVPSAQHKKTEDRIIYVPTSNGGLSPSSVEHLINSFKSYVKAPLSVEQLREARLDAITAYNPVVKKTNVDVLSGISYKPQQDERPDINEDNLGHLHYENISDSSDSELIRAGGDSEGEHKQEKEHKEEKYDTVEDYNNAKLKRGTKPYYINMMVEKYGYNADKITKNTVKWMQKEIMKIQQEANIVSNKRKPKKPRFIG